MERSAPPPATPNLTPPPPPLALPPPPTPHAHWLLSLHPFLSLPSLSLHSLPFSSPSLSFPFYVSPYPPPPNSLPLLTPSFSLSLPHSPLSLTLSPSSLPLRPHPSTPLSPSHPPPLFRFSTDLPTKSGSLLIALKKCFPDASQGVQLAASVVLTSVVFALFTSWRFQRRGAHNPTRTARAVLVCPLLCHRAPSYRPLASPPRRFSFDKSQTVCMTTTSAWESFTVDSLCHRPIRHGANP